MAFTPQDTARETRAADERIRPHARETHLELSPYYRDVGGAAVFFKLENMQHTGSFKARGASNKVAALDAGALARGLITASGGNHGLGVAYAGWRAGAPVRVVLPRAPCRSGGGERAGGAALTVWCWAVCSLCVVATGVGPHMHSVNSKR